MMTPNRSGAPLRARFGAALRGIFLLIVLVCALVIAANFWVIRAGAGQVYGNPDQLPVNNVGLVLGTSPRTGARKNLFFEGRMETAARLFKEGKVRHLLL